MAGVAILDCGAQYAKVIDRRVRELGVHSDILPVATPASKLKSYDAIIISGGPASVTAKGSPQPDPRIFSLKKPLLGICYGMQLLAHYGDGDVGKQPTREYGETTVLLDPSSLLFRGLAKSEQVLMSHWDSVIRAPDGYSTIATSDDGLIAAIAKPAESLYGVQFHPEVDLTINGKRILSNFLFRIAKLKKTHTIAQGIAHAIRDVRAQVGKSNVAVLVSGGVDSAVTAALLLKALPKRQVHAIHVDHGFMRKGESDEVMRALVKLGLANARRVDAHETFANATAFVDGKRTKPLREVTDPEDKRTIIGDTFMRIADAELARISGKSFLAQGTLRPDLIESASSLVTTSADKIKTHHNDSPLVRERRKRGLIVETNTQWHKDEVRAIARKLGLPPAIARREPFPGPGLAVRILCANAGAAEDVRTLSREVSRAAKAFGLAGCALPVRSVGVQGDERTYAHAALVWGTQEWGTLKRASAELPRKIHAINRVCYLLAGDPERMSIVPTHLTEDVVGLEREADALVRTIARKHGIGGKIAQMPIVLLPLRLGKPGRTVVLRPFVTNDFMTGRAAAIGEEISRACVRAVTKALMRLEGVGAVLYDLSSKPPGTTEWE